MRRHSQDILAGVLVIVVNLVVFGYHSGRLGFYADDAGFLSGIYPGMGVQQLISAIGSYVTGRNLHILWQYIVSVIAGGSGLENLPAMHYVQVAADALAGLLLFVAFRLWRIERSAAFIAAIGFSFYPVHDETHYWLSALPMNIMSTVFVLALVCLSAALLRALSEEDRNSAKLSALLMLYLPVFLCSMFTYDQVVPVTMVVVTLAAAAVFYRHPKLRVFAVGAWCFCLVVFVSLLIWKVRVPAGGPIFLSLSIGHILQNLRESVSIWLSLLSSRALAHPLRGATDIEQMMAVAIAAVTVVATWFFLKRHDGEAVKNSSGVAVAAASGTQGLIFNLAVLGAGMMFYLLAYLPAYLWYLSPRHSYFPSVGVATIAAGLFGACAPLATRTTPFRFLVLLFIGVLLTGFVTRNLREKDLWITAFEMRKTMYQTVAAHYASDNPTTLLLSGFPSSIAIGGSSLGFLSGENADAPSIMTKGKIVADAISIHPVPSQSGYFIKTEEGRWGDEPFVQVPRAHTTVVLFESIDEGKLNTYYDVGRDQLRSSQFYSLTPIAQESGLPAFSASVSAAGYDLELPAVSLKKDEVLALVAYTLKDGRKSPASHSTEADMEGYVLPVDVSDARDGAAHAFHLEYKVSMTHIDGFRLYRIDGAQAQAIAEVSIK